MVYGLFCCSWYMFGIKTEYFCTWSICDCWNWKDHRSNFISLWGSFKPFKAWWMRFKDYKRICPRVLLWILSISISDKEKTPCSSTTNILWFLLIFHVVKTTFNKLPMTGNGHHTTNQKLLMPGGWCRWHCQTTASIRRTHCLRWIWSCGKGIRGNSPKAQRRLAAVTGDGETKPLGGENTNLVWILRHTHMVYGISTI